MLTSTITAIQIASYCNQLLSGKITRDNLYEGKINEHWELCLFWKIGCNENTVFKWIEKIKASGVKRIFVRFSRFENVYLISPDTSENWDIETNLLERDPKVKWRFSLCLSNEIYQDYEKGEIDVLLERAKVELSDLSKYLKENKFPEYEQVETARKIVSREITKEFGYIHHSFDQERKMLVDASISAWNYGSKSQWYGVNEKEIDNCRKKLRRLHINLVHNIENGVNLGF